MMLLLHSFLCLLLLYEKLLIMRVIMLLLHPLHGGHLARLKLARWLRSRICLSLHLRLFLHLYRLLPFLLHCILCRRYLSMHELLKLRS